MELERLHLAQKDERALEMLVEEQRPFILRCAARTVHQTVTISDEVWPAALEGFVHAVRTYQPERGGFSSYAETVIRNRVLDQLRRKARSAVEFPVDPILFDAPPSDEVEELPLRLSVAHAVTRNDEEEQRSLRWEIEAAVQVFSQYGFSFYELAACSPKSQKTRRACSQAVNCLLDAPVLVQEMRSAKVLPLKPLTQRTGVPRKTLERHRNYIIAAAEILTGEYPYLAEYLRTMREEAGR